MARTVISDIGRIPAGSADDDDAPGPGAHLGPLCGDVESAAAEVEGRPARDQVTVRLSRAAAQDYVRYGVESAPYDVWRAISEALEASQAPLPHRRAG